MFSVLPHTLAALHREKSGISIKEFPHYCT
jgi:hypothetical protein